LKFRQDKVEISFVMLKVKMADKFDALLAGIEAPSIS